MSTELESGLGRLVLATKTVISALEKESDAQMRWVCARLRDSVVRPLERNRQPPAPEERSSPPAGTLSEQLWDLARVATLLHVQCPDVLELVEATAGLQDVAIGLASDSLRDSRVTELATLQADLEPLIQVVRNGPYLVTNPRRLVDWLGQPLPLRPQMALCRCGKSQLKPLCDGTHASIDFSDAKDPDRVPDRRESYVGQQVTIFDNRGICQHSGYCTDRLASVFHLNQEPFITPSGGRMDEIIRAVRDCPSGALSYAIDDVEARDEVDYHGKREPVIEVTRDGPYRITGGIRLVDINGADVPRNQGASLEHYPLCRCGESQNKPFCSGMHWYAEFHHPVPEKDREPTVFEWAGGLPALTRMTRLFYEKFVPQDPLLAPLFASMSSDHPQRVAKWLAEVFCGPKAYSSEFGGYPRMLSQHRGKQLTEEQRTRWVSLLLQSAREAGLPNDAEFRSAFGAYIEWGSRLAVENSQSGAKPPEHMPMPRWDWNTAAGPPGSRISAQQPSPTTEARPTMTAPRLEETISFAQHIKGLFRATDRNSMKWAFDLWSVDQVRLHADAILERLRAGTMPCDGAWPPERIDTFERWKNSGMND